jgi:hypothetical protein
MVNIYKVLAKPYAKHILEALDKQPFLNIDQISGLLGQEPDTIKKQVEQFQALGLVLKSVLTSGYHLTSQGKICLILCDMVEGGSLKEGIRKLFSYIDEEFELLTENITDNFLAMIRKGRIFQNIYICSPWIQISNSERAILQKVIKDSRKSIGEKVGILIITRPPDVETLFGRKIAESLRWLDKLGSDISLVKRLHTKLYIAEPGPHGGPFFAVFGSENLTGARNIELGIKIVNNPHILNKLVSYFFDIFSRGKPYRKIQGN